MAPATRAHRNLLCVAAHAHRPGPVPRTLPLVSPAEVNPVPHFIAPIRAHGPVHLAAVVHPFLATSIPTGTPARPPIRRTRTPHGAEQSAGHGKPAAIHPVPRVVSRRGEGPQQRLLSKSDAHADPGSAPGTPWTSTAATRCGGSGSRRTAPASSPTRGGRARQNPGADLDQQHPLHGHRVRLRRPAQRTALPRARDGVRPGLPPLRYKRAHWISLTSLRTCTPPRGHSAGHTTCPDPFRALPDTTRHRSQRRRRQAGKSTATLVVQPD